MATLAAPPVATMLGTVPLLNGHEPTDPQPLVRSEAAAMEERRCLYVFGQRQVSGGTGAT